MHIFQLEKGTEKYQNTSSIMSLRDKLQIETVLLSQRILLKSSTTVGKGHHQTKMAHMANVMTGNNFKESTLKKSVATRIIEY